jgi:hypothetical protein
VTIEADGGITIQEGLVSLVQALPWTLVVPVILIYLGKPLKRQTSKVHPLSVS